MGSELLMHSVPIVTVLAYFGFFVYRWIVHARDD